MVEGTLKIKLLLSVNRISAKFWLEYDNFNAIQKHYLEHCLCLDPSLNDTAISIINATYRIR